MNQFLMKLLAFARQLMNNVKIVFRSKKEASIEIADGHTKITQVICRKKKIEENV